MNKNKSIILIPPCNTYGDILSIISMIYFLLNYYYKVYLYFLSEQYSITNYYKHFFNNNNNNILFLMSNEAENILNSYCYDSFHICNTHTGCWSHNINNYILYHNKNINHEHYFCDTNPLYNFLDIPEEDLCKQNVSLPLKEKEINSIVYYKMVGLSNHVRMNYFEYKRNFEKENSTNFEIRNNFNLSEDEKYNIICSTNEFTDINRIKKKINNNYKSIDINFLVEFPGWLFKLIENAEELHLIEGCNVNFIYFSQYKNIIHLNSKKIYLHIWARNRNWNEYNLDYGWKMICYPQLNNWNLVFEE
jgi:hypothetical protein